VQSKKEFKHGGWRKKDPLWFRYSGSPRDSLKHSSARCGCQQLRTQASTYFHSAVISIRRNSLGRPDPTPLGFLRGVRYPQVEWSLQWCDSPVLIPFFIEGKSKGFWLHSLSSGCRTTCDDLTRALFTKFFPLSDTASQRNQITNFLPKEDEMLYKA